MAGRLVAGASSCLVILALTACGAGGSSAVTPSAGTSASTTAPASAATSPATSSPTEAGTSAPSGPLTPRTATGAVVPGSAYQRGPAAGQALAVLGVAAGSTIPVQDLPGTDGTVLRRLTPLSTRLVATGRARELESGTRSAVWAEVTTAGVTGWVDAAYLAAPADTTDVTAEVVGRLGRRPTAGTMLDLGRAVAQVYVSEEPPSRVSVAVAPTVGDLGEVTMDVVGLGDDSLSGMRLHVFGAPGGTSFTLKSVEATPFCSRGVTSAGLCS